MNFLSSTVDSRKKNPVAWSHPAYEPPPHGVQISAAQYTTCFTTNVCRATFSRTLLPDINGTSYDQVIAEDRTRWRLIVVSVRSPTQCTVELSDTHHPHRGHRLSTSDSPSCNATNAPTTNTQTGRWTHQTQQFTHGQHICK